MYLESVHRQKYFKTDTIFIPLYIYMHINAYVLVM